MIKVKIKRLTDTAIIPTYGSDKAAGMDLYADLKSEGLESIIIEPNTSRKIGTGFAFQPPENYVGLIYARSGLSTKQGLRPANCVGICDEDYRGNYIVPLYNDSDKAQMINHGDRIAQLLFTPYEQASLVEVDSLSDTKRGDGGFASTGK